ncbi:hypothetical protein [Nannocystis punicea]|uniref:HTH iclR-type domain-containing protein n=1 Tax=Nannocystis punicea TaxID=2995304 RepID=A0ABY7HD80_9BACT|nr:hypothetical protein [Nannocystis poenicansa]WAS97229.1 hypothetical protein O0S08_13865 [Nannocystis poenicansa]
MVMKTSGAETRMRLRCAAGELCRDSAKGLRHIWPMSILHRLRSDLQRSVAEHQAILLAQVLRQRFTELTLGDLREILTSPLGRGLDNLKLAELSQNAAAGDVSRGGGKTAKRGGGRVSRTDASASLRSGRSPSATSSDYVSSIVEMLQSAGTGLTSGELRARLGGSPSTMYRAVTELIKAGKVHSEGKPARYSWIPGAEYEVPEDEDDDAATLPPPSKRGRPPVVSARTLEGRAHYDSAVMTLLQQTNGWIGASQLRAHVGGSDNQVRIALHRLVASGQVARRGERNSTEYRVTSRA